jgi:hypothetical protein
MGRGHSKFRKRDVQSAVAGARAAGVEINTIVMKPDGTMELKAGKPAANLEAGGNSWDEVLEHDENQTTVSPKIHR